MAYLSSFLDTGDKVASVVSGVLAIAGFWLAVRAGSRRRDRVRRDGRLRALLDAQRADSGRHRYRFFGRHVPALDELYVLPRAQTHGPSAHRPVEATQVLTAHRHAVLLGDAGAGKSTFLATVAGRQAARPRSRRRTEIAVVIHASDLLGRTLPDALSHAVRRDFGLEVPAGLFERPPPRTAWRVMVDGLDEVVDAPSRSAVLWRLRDLVTETGPYRFLITSRPLAGAELADLRTGGVGWYDLRPFDRRQLAEFARRWFAMRYPDDRRRAEETAGRFLARIAGARLGPVARVPLLATIAALVYESQDGGALPSSRADLYQRFADHLLDGRRSLDRFRDAVDAELTGRGSAGKALAEWLWSDLHRHVGGLLDACGSAWIADPGVPLIDVALGWIRDHGPADPAAVAPDGRRLVRELLLATGLCALRHEQVTFAHQSFAEYFAARATAGEFDGGSWLAEVADPLTRSRAAFAVARRPDADRLVRALIEAGPVTAAGELLADGVPMDPATSARIVDLLIAQVVEETDLAPDAMRLLAELSVDAEVLGRMAALARRADVPVWTRALIADQIAGLDPELGNTLLRLVAPDADDVARSWIADALEEHGARVDPQFRLPLGGASPEAAGGSLGPLARQALTRRLTDARTTEFERVEAARQLALGGDLTPLRAMVDAADIDPLGRVRIAATLAGAGDPAPLRELATAAGSSPSAAYATALAVFDLSVPAALVALRQVTRRFPNRPLAFGAAARAAELGDPGPLRALVRDSRQPQIRLVAAGRLAALGDTAPLDRLLETARDPFTEAFVLTEQLRAGRAADPGRLSRLLRGRRIRPYRRVELRYLMATAGDTASRDELHRMLRHPTDSFLAVHAAVALALTGDPRGPAWLAKVAFNRRWNHRARAQAVAGLAEADPDTGRKVVDRLAGEHTSSGIPVRAATVALHRWGDPGPLAGLALDPAVAPGDRTTAAEIVVDVALGARAPSASAFYLARSGSRTADREPGAAGRSPVPAALRHELAALASDRRAPASVRIAVTPLVGRAEARALLIDLAGPAGPAGLRISVIRRLNELDGRAAGQAFGELIRDPGTSRLRRWGFLYTDSDLLAPADEAALRDVLPDAGPVVTALRLGRLVLRRPERVLGP